MWRCCLKDKNLLQSVSEPKTFQGLFSLGNPAPPLHQTEKKPGDVCSEQEWEEGGEEIRWGGAGSRSSPHEKGGESRFLSDMSEPIQDGHSVGT